MTILITGINGFIGSSLANYFSKLDYNVVGIDCKGGVSNFNVIEMDMLVEDFDSTLQEIAPDIVIHCAGAASVPFSNEYPHEDFLGNTALVHKLLFSMCKNGFRNRRFILLSSAAVYGQPDVLPISEDAAMNPISPYALHKKMAEDVCSYFINNYNMDIRIARIFSAYGVGLKKQIFWDMHQKIVDFGEIVLSGTGNESRDFINVCDVCKAIELIALTDKNKEYYIWNVANGIDYKMSDVALLFAELWREDKAVNIKFTSKVREGDPSNWRADISRLKKLGYTPSTKIEDGIRDYVRWVKQIEG